MRRGGGAGRRLPGRKQARCYKLLGGLLWPAMSNLSQRKREGPRYTMGDGHATEAGLDRQESDCLSSR